VKDSIKLKYDLICLGNLTIDDIVLPDQTQQIGCFGGDTIYSALGASYWSDQVGFVAPIGTDFPQEHLATLRASHWDTQGLPQRSIPSIRNWVIYEDNNHRNWVLESNPDDFFELSPAIEDIPIAYLNSSAFMILAMDLAAQESLAPNLHQYGLVAVDPQEDYIEGNIDRILGMLKNVDIFMPSQVEVFRLLGHHDYERACHEFATYGASTVVVKMGSEGSLIYDHAKNCFWRIPIFNTRIVDTTGAGDAYCGGFMAMFIKTDDLFQAGLAGAVSASFAIEGSGLTHMFNITKQEALSRLEELRVIISQEESWKDA
jgi:sugar/nucleoside kinase (ribokinase family)